MILFKGKSLAAPLATNKSSRNSIFHIHSVVNSAGNFFAQTALPRRQKKLKNKLNAIERVTY